MSRFDDETFLSYAVVDDRTGQVLRGCDWAVNSRIVPGGQQMTSEQDQADYIAGWAPFGPDQTVHVWLGGGVGVEVRLRTLLDGLPPADATAPSQVPVGGVR
jgi:hypothetical protein